MGIYVLSRILILIKSIFKGKQYQSIKRIGFGAGGYDLTYLDQNYTGIGSSAVFISLSSIINRVQIFNSVASEKSSRSTYCL